MMLSVVVQPVLEPVVQSDVVSQSDESVTVQPVVVAACCEASHGATCCGVACYGSVCCSHPVMMQPVVV